LKTIFNYGYGTGLTGRQDWWDDPWIEHPWLDNGRLTFDREDFSTHHDLYHQAAVIARIDGLAPVLRGVQDAGFQSLALLRTAAEVFNFDFQAAGHEPPSFTPFVDTGAFGDVISLPGRPVAFDFTNQSH
jgi:hypothetical protein